MAHKKIKRKSKTAQFNDEELLAYMKLPAKDKLERLEQMNHFLKKIRPLKSQRIAQQLAQEGF